MRKGIPLRLQTLLFSTRPSAITAVGLHTLFAGGQAGRGRNTNQCRVRPGTVTKDKRLDPPIHLGSLGRQSGPSSHSSCKTRFSVEELVIQAS